MQSYDISHLPQPVHDAVLHLMETLVQAFPSPAEDITEAAALVPASPQRPTQGAATLPAVPGMEQPSLPTPMHCPHGAQDTPCCVACTTLYRAEAVLVDAQTAVQQHWPRSAVELRILEALQQLAPLPVTPRQVAAMLGLPAEQVRLLLQALATLDTIDRPAMGYYRHKATALGDPTPHAAPRHGAMPEAVVEVPARQHVDGHQDASPHPDSLWQRETREHQALAFVRTAFPRPVAPHELREQLGSGQARAVLKTLCARGQVEWVGHGRYRYRATE